MFSICLLLLLLTYTLCQECPLSPQCADKEYLDLDQDPALCKPLPSDFTVQFNATEYNIYICVGEEQVTIPADEVLFSFTVYINNNTAMSTDVFFLTIDDFDNKFKFQSTGGVSSELYFFMDNSHLFNVYEFTVMTANPLPVNYYETYIIPQLGSLDLTLIEVTINNITIPMYQCNGTECLNGGTCIPGTHSNYTCTCIEGYEGDECEHESDPCDPNPCQNNGNCSSISNTVYMCECISGYIGQNCTIDIDECANVSCGNGGTCMDLINGYQCICDAGYTGDHCTNTLITDAPTSSVLATHIIVIPSSTSETKPTTASYDTTGTSLRSSTTANVVPSPHPDSETSLSMSAVIGITVAVTVVVIVPITIAATLLLVGLYNCLKKPKKKRDNTYMYQSPPRSPADEDDQL